MELGSRWNAVIRHRCDLRQRVATENSGDRSFALQGELNFGTGAVSTLCVNLWALCVLYVHSASNNFRRVCQIVCVMVIEDRRRAWVVTPFS